MTFSRISEFAAVTSYLGFVGATVLRRNPRTLAIIAAVGFAFDLIQANNRPERPREEFLDGDIEMGGGFGHPIPRHREGFGRERLHYPYAGGAAVRGARHRDEDDEWGDAGVPGRDDRAGAGHAWEAHHVIGGRAGAAGRAAGEYDFEEEEAPGVLAKLKNKVSAAFHAVCAGSTWVSNKIHLKKTYAYHYAVVSYSLIKNFYAGFLPQEEEE